VYSKSFEDHLVHVEDVLDRLIDAKFKLKPEKCVFAADEVPYLGFIVSTDGVRPDPDKIAALAERPFTKSAKEMVRFFGEH
jgi:hypothetical protein